MTVLKVSLFGSFQFENSSSDHARLTSTIQAFLAFLLLNRHRTYPRDVLAGLFWETNDPKSARNCLNTAIWRLRKNLEPVGTPPGTFLTTTVDGEIGFNAYSDYWLDVAEFEEVVKPFAAKPDLVEENLPAGTFQKLESTLHLYKGDLLEGQYADWALRERERFRLMHINSLCCLARYFFQQGAFPKTIFYCQQLLGFDPLREEVHRLLMRSYLENGERTMAVRQYQACQVALLGELGIQPMEETTALYNQILGQQPDLQKSSQTMDLDYAIDELKLAMRTYEQARVHAQRALTIVEKMRKKSL